MLSKTKKPSQELFELNKTVIADHYHCQLFEQEIEKKTIFYRKRSSLLIKFFYQDVRSHVT